MNNHAPIAIFAFRRLDHLRATLSALQRCPEFSQSQVTVFSDGARPGVSGEAEAVQEVRSYLQNWSRLHGAIVKEAPRNLGLRQSITAGVTALLACHDRVVVLEDDIIVSPVFLSYMNQALHACQDRQDIFQICAYMVPHRLKLPQIGLIRVGTCWGWATWRRAWQYYNDDAENLLSGFKSEDICRFNMDCTCHNFSDLLSNASAAMNTWAVRWDASIFLRKGLSVLPSQSLTRNIGFGAGATNCGDGSVGRRLRRQRIRSTAFNFDWNSLGGTETPEFLEAIKEFNRWQTSQWTNPTLRARLSGRVRQLVKQVRFVTGIDRNPK